MEKVFNEFYNLSNIDIEAVWSNALIVFDTNILLNFYRYSEETITEFSNVLDEMKERLWLPYQIGKEFHEERLNVIIQQVKVYNESISKIKDIEKEFLNENRNPFLSNSLLQEFTSILDKVNKELEEKSEKYEASINNDDILKKISNIFKDKVGLDYSELKTKEIYNQGNKRFNEKTPPGYEDKNKPENRKYGDLIIWFQIIDKAKEANKPIIFVTDDRKEDWWLIKSGKKISARPELKKEFWKETNNIFHLYQPFKFLEYAKENLKISIKKATINEVKELSSIEYSIPKPNDLLITMIMEQTTPDHNLIGFIQLLELNGYDITYDKIGDSEFIIYVSILNIPDLVRRIRSKFISQLPLYGLRLIEFHPDIN